MILHRPSCRIASLVLLFGVFLALSGCSDDRGSVTSPYTPDPSTLKISRQAHLWISFENVVSNYVDASSDAWLTDSWVTKAGSFDLVVQNNAKFSTQNVVLLVTVPSEFVAMPGWSIMIDGTVLNPSSFTETDPSLYGFDGGSHGVYPPSGDGVFCPFPLAATLAKKSQISVPVVASSGDIPGFKIHFDVGSSALYNPASHDATVVPPVTPPLPTGACCLFDYSCAELTQGDCEAQGGTYNGDGVVCTPELCAPPPPPVTGACCLFDYSCAELTQGDCEAQGGTYNGDGVVCTPELCAPPPPPATGACCLADYSCAELTQADCGAQGGTYNGDGVVCTPELCAPPPIPGACCLISGSCVELLQAECEAPEQNGVFMGPGSTCGTSNCGD